MSIFFTSFNSFNFFLVSASLIVLHLILLIKSLMSLNFSLPTLFLWLKLLLSIVASILLNLSVSYQLVELLLTSLLIDFIDLLYDSLIDLLSGSLINTLSITSIDLLSASLVSFLVDCLVDTFLILSLLL